SRSYLNAGCTESARLVDTHDVGRRLRPYDLVVRTDWVDRMDARVARLLADLCIADLTDIPALLGRFIDEIEAPPDRMHGAMLAVSILQVIRAVVERAHTRHPVNGCTCYAAACEPLERLARHAETDTGVVF